MGIAAYNRGSKVISRHYDDERRAQLDAEQRRRALEEDTLVNDWRQRAWAFFVEASQGDRRGLVARAIYNAAEIRGGVYEARLTAVVEAQNAWVDSAAHRPLTHLEASIRWARAVYRLLDWCRIPFKLSILEEAPRAVKERV